MFLKFRTSWHHVDSVIGLVETADRSYVLQKDGKLRYHTSNCPDLPEEIVEFPADRTILVGHGAGREIVIGKLFIISPEISGYLYEKDGNVHVPGPDWHITVHGCRLTELIED